MLMLMAKRSRSLLFDYKFIALLVLVAASKSISACA
jgi:molybdenum-dependent DNA-binding transcriptional regulator ModE